MAVGGVVRVDDGAAVDICVQRARLPFAGKTQIKGHGTDQRQATR